MIWIHVHKNAGTSICKLARLNNETIVQESPDGHHTDNTNCLWWEHDHFDQLNESTRVACADRIEAFGARHWTFGMIEREFHHGDMCEGFLYGITLREPVSRAVSNALYDGIDVRRDLQCLRDGAPSCGQMLRGAHSWVIFDNYHVRTLLGERGLKIPPGQVTKQHAQQVIGMLEQFAIVTFVDELDSATPLMLRHTLGWRQTPSTHKRSKHEGYAKHDFSTEEMAYIAKLNEMDRMVYDHFKAVPAAQRGR